MAPSLLKLSAAALACAVGISAADPPKTYQLSDSYNKNNFFDKFDFFTGQDPTWGFVKYQNKKDATTQGLIATQGDEVYIGVDHKSTGKDLAGRASVRLESQKQYNGGLIIAKFTHLPKVTCGAWPAFWMVGNQWPQDGEIDIYEQWNLASHNMVTLHTGNVAEVGECVLDKTPGKDYLGQLNTYDCWNDAPSHFANQGCGVVENPGQWGKADGGVYATDWQESGIRVWSWANGKEPADIKNGTPNPSTWGKPIFALLNNNCDIKRAFKNQRLVLNIDFCGTAAGQDGLWKDCKAITQEPTCDDFVRNHPDAFADVFWKIAYIDVYQLGTAKPSTTSATSTTSKATTSSTTSKPSTTSTTSKATISSTTLTTSKASTTSVAAVSNPPVVTFSANPSVSTFPANEPSSISTFPAHEPSLISTFPANEPSSISTFPANEPSLISTFPANEPSSISTFSAIVPSSVAASGSAAVSSSAVASSDVVSSSVVASSAAVSSAPVSSISEVPGSGSSGVPVPASSDVPVPGSSGVPVSYGPGSTASESETPCTSTDYPVETSSESETPCTSTDYPVETSSDVPVETSSNVPVSSASETPCTTSTEIPVSTTKYTTSTVYSTKTYTVTSCSPTVTNCPANGGSYVTTEVVPIYTTVCPVEENSSATHTTDVEENTSATYTTDVEENTSATYASDSTTTDTTTLSLTTTEYVPVKPTSYPVYPSGGSGSGHGYPEYPGKNTTISIGIKPTGGFAPPAPVFSGSYSPEKPEATRPVTAGSARFGISGLVMVAAAAVMFL